MSLLLAGDLPYIMVVGEHVQFLSLSKDYPLPKYLEGLKKKVGEKHSKVIGTMNDGTPALFLGK